MLTFPKGDNTPLSTHIPLLMRVFELSEGDVLEIGTGYFSTLLLHWYSKMFKRHVYSYETRGYWWKRSKQYYESDYHHIIRVDNWDQADFGEKRWGMVFIDHGPDHRRITEIRRLANKTDFMVIHDTDPERDEVYHYSTVLSEFKYRYDYTALVPNTSVVSNTVDVKALIEEGGGCPVCEERADADYE